VPPLDLPQGVDAPPSLLLWRLDDLIPLILMLMVGILADRLLMFVLLGLALSRLYGRFRDSRPDGFALHWAYWHGLVPLAARSCPNPFSRCWRG
jgi:conjugal transfer pilus assembly protein TraL